MDRIKALFTVFKYGEEVIDPAKWKARQIDINILVPFISGIFVVVGGNDLPFDPEDIINLSLGIVAVSNIVLTLITSKKVGM